MIDDFDRCLRAVESRDPRFDGWFFTAVVTTGIYCRPSCPAVTPKRHNVRFYASVAAAHVAGAIALMQQVAVEASGCYLTAHQVLDILRSTADPMAGYQDHEVGAGALDVTDAVARASVGGPRSIDPFMCPRSSSG